MLLSEAILLGSTLNPQGFGEFEQNSPIFGTVATCAWGAAYRAIGAEIGVDPPEWEYAEKLVLRCPGCEFRFSVGCLIPHLNDDHRWTRERIAELIAKIEPQEPETPASQPSELLTEVSA